MFEQGSCQLKPLPSVNITLPICSRGRVADRSVKRLPSSSQESQLLIGMHRPSSNALNYSPGYYALREIKSRTHLAVIEEPFPRALLFVRAEGVGF